MKILLAHLYDASFGMGGAEVVVLNLAKSLKEKGCEIRAVLNPGDMAEKMRALEIPVNEVSYSKLKTYGAIKTLCRVLKEFKPDIVHSHHRYMTFLLSAFFRKRSRILHTEHVIRRDKTFFFRYGHMASGVHETVSENLVRHYKVPSASVVTIPNAVVIPPLLKEKAEELRRKYPRKADELFGFFIGRLEEQKGHSYLIDAVKEMNESKRRKIRFFLAGTGSLEAALKKRAADAGVQDSFIFLGQCREIPEYLDLCDFLVLPSLWEGMPLSVLEAFGAAKPVLATDIEGTREMVRSGENGLLVNPRDAGALRRGIEEILTHPERLSAMGSAAFQKWKTEYSYEKMIASYQALYKEMLRIEA